jgi:calcineurin-like phosphoesterase
MRLIFLGDVVGKSGRDAVSLESYRFCASATSLTSSW